MNEYLSISNQFIRFSIIVVYNKNDNRVKLDVNYLVDRVTGVFYPDTICSTDKLKLGLTKMGKGFGS